MPVNQSFSFRRFRSANYFPHSAFRISANYPYPLYNTLLKINIRIGRHQLSRGFKYCWWLGCCTGRPLPGMRSAGLLYIFSGWIAAATVHQPMWVVSQVQRSQAQPPRHQLDTVRRLLHEVYSSLILHRRPTQHSIILLTHNSICGSSSIISVCPPPVNQSISRGQLCSQLNGRSHLLLGNVVCSPGHYVSCSPG